MLRTLVGGGAALLLSACASGSTTTSTAGSKVAVTFTGAVAGVARLSGEGPGHVCGLQPNNMYHASMRTTVGDQQIVVSLDLARYSGPGEYQLDSRENDVTVAILGGNPVLGGPTWISDSGRVSFDVSDEYAGSIQAHLKPFNARTAGEVSMSGHWTCERNAGPSAQAAPRALRYHPI
jgi:hypothetical protein